MDGDLQEFTKHCVLKDSTNKDPRISFVFLQLETNQEQKVNQPKSNQQRQILNQSSKKEEKLENPQDRK